MAHRELVLVELKEERPVVWPKRRFRFSLHMGVDTRFKRSDGWGVVGKNQLRDSQNDRAYDGVERRQVV